MALKGGLLGAGAAVAIVLLAVSWQGRMIDLWLTSDQQGRWYFERGHYQAAAAAFEDPLWKGIATYAAGDFVAATQIFERLDGAAMQVHRGNSLAHRDLLDEALAAYGEALRREPGNAQASANFDWVSGIVEVRDARRDEDDGDASQIGADDFVVDDRAQEADRTLTMPQERTQGLTDDELEAMWMRRVQTTPGDFLALKFSFQASDAQDEAGDEP